MTIDELVSNIDDGKTSKYISEMNDILYYLSLEMEKIADNNSESYIQLLSLRETIIIDVSAFILIKRGKK